MRDAVTAMEAVTVAAAKDARESAGANNALRIELAKRDAEIERQSLILIEKGVIRLPDHAIRAMETKYDGQPGVRADRFVKVGV